MTPHETDSTGTPGTPRATAPPAPAAREGDVRQFVWAEVLINSGVVFPV